MKDIDKKEFFQDMSNIMNKNDGKEAAPEANWEEDYVYDQDKCYICLCGDCRKYFLGNKGRMVCKLCSNVKQG